MLSFSAVFTSLLAISASALAYTTPTTFNQTSNPIYKPNSGDIVPVGKPYEITWGPTESGTVTIVLLRGPSTNIVPLYAIAEKIKNTGSYTWTPKSDLEDDTTHYGLEIIIDSNGQYQYSTQFGISNPGHKPVTTTSYKTVHSTTKTYSTSMITVTTPYTSYTPTSTPFYNTTMTTAPSETESTPSPTTSSTTVPSPSQTGGASSVKVASGLLIGVAGVAALLF